jgi:hypothetical protein
MRKYPVCYLAVIFRIGLQWITEIAWFCTIVHPLCDQVVVTLQEENNNNVVSQGGGGGTASDVVTSSTTPAKSATSLLDSRAKKFTIAAANPLLAG